MVHSRNFYFNFRLCIRWDGLDFKKLYLNIYYIYLYYLYFEDYKNIFIKVFTNFNFK